MKTSEQINELAAALSKAQGEIEGAHKDSANPFFKSKYADLASIWEACRGPLSKNGLAVVQLPRLDGNFVVMETRLLHSSGQWIEGELAATAKDDGPQAVGSTCTYLRRYALQSVIGVAPEDDDGEAATDRSRPPERKSNGRNKAQEVAAAHGMKTGDEIKPPDTSAYDKAVAFIEEAGKSFEQIEAVERMVDQRRQQKKLTDREHKLLIDKLCRRAIELCKFPPDLRKAVAFLKQMREANRITAEEDAAYLSMLAEVEEALAQPAA